MLGTGADCGKLELANFVFPHFMFAHEIFDDPAHEGQGAICFFDGEDLFHVPYTASLTGRGQVLEKCRAGSQCGWGTWRHARSGGAPKCTPSLRSVVGLLVAR